MTTTKKKILGLVVVALTAIACAPKADKAECEKMVDKMIDVELEGQSAAVAAMTKKMMQADRDKMLNDCVGKVTKKEVQCVIDAKTKADVDKCG
jgi:small lipoprotein (TIGR04454 family)